MSMFAKASGLTALSALALIVVVSCSQEQPVSFAQDVQPVLEKYCTECHLPGGQGLEASGFSMESYEDLMAGARGGPMIIAGDSLGSNMLVLMEGRADPSISMPHDKSVAASQAELEIIRAWIDQGAQNN